MSTKKCFITTMLCFLIINVSAFAQCTEAKDTEMAKYKRLTETQDAQGCSQCALLALYFCSARHTSTNEDKSKVSSMINACKSNIQQMGQPYCCPEYINKQPEWGKDLNKSNSTSANANMGSASNSSFENKLNNAIDIGQKLQSSFYSLQEVDKNRKELNDLSTLKGKFNSIEEIEMAFQKKFNQIASAVDKTVNAENAAMTNNVNTMNQLLGGDQVMGQWMGLAGGLLNNIGAEERKREYEAQLKKQKEEQISKLKAMKASQVVEVRKTFLETFQDGGMPVSSKSIDHKEIYVFSYSTNTFTFIRDKPKLTVTNVFPIKRSTENDVWLFKNTLVKDLRKHFNEEETPRIMGYFTSEKDANSMRDSFLYLASQCDFDLKFSTYSYQNKIETNNNSNNDFWKN